jgi:hypothetical protein
MKRKNEFIKVNLLINGQLKVLSIIFNYMIKLNKKRSNKNN